MNSQQIFALLELAENAKKTKDWKIISKFLEVFSPELAVELCSDLLESRAGTNKTPSIIPSKMAMEKIFKSNCEPNKNKIANGFSLSYPLRKDEMEISIGNKKHITRIEIINAATKNNTLDSLKSKLKDLAKIDSWELTIEIGARKGYSYSVSFMYTRPKRKEQLGFL